MEIQQDLASFQDKVSGLSREAFLARHSDPILVIDLGIPEGKTEEFQTMDGTKKPDRSTEPISRTTGKAACALAIPVVKSDRNTFDNMITLGRASNNDIIIPHASVSKFHAYFRVDADTGTFSISDAGSSYGTHLNGEEVRKGESYPIQSGTTLAFAKSVAGKFFSPADFFDFMHR